ncbi:MAG: CapA family protein, partial [Anaerolineales bacterium]
VQAAWGGDGPPLMVGEDTLSVFTALWGPPSAGVRPVPPDRLLDSAWDQRPVWAIIPFESLEPRWKVLAVDGQSPLHKDFDPETYPLVVPFGLYGDAGLVKAVTVLFGPESGSPMLPASNRDPDKLTTVAMTGVTALVRATAWTMERRGVTYPAQDIGDWLRGADITHISNEVPFARDCPYPDPVQEGVVFCSDARYIELLEAVGTDVVELTGDHFHDWGPEAMLYTLELYDERGWPYYGGGANYEDGRGAALLEHNGNRFAFIGCNGKGGSFAQASATRPGAVACDFDWLHAETARLTREGYLVIATFQHFEYYSYTAPPNMQADFRGMAEAGAVIVSGSQAHHPHALEFWDGALLHFGLGNLFFDQYGLSPGTDEGFIDRHVFYDGRHISTELLAIVFVDYARPRPMTAGERAALLRVVFAAGGW